jgi:penicillin-binding protein 1A
MMNDMMRETLVTGTARKADLPGWEAAGKTGTSQDFRDAWFIGYTSRLVAGVWLGNDDSSPTKKASGGNLPVEIWSRFMTIALKGQPVARLPSGAWRSETAAMPEEIAKPIDDLIGLFTGESKPPARRETRPAPRSAPRPAAPPPDETPIPPPMASAQEAPSPVPPERPSAPRSVDDLLPPEDIPTVGSIPPRARPSQRRAAPEKNIFEQLFGGG